MATLHDFFVAEATDHLDRFEETLDSGEPDLDLLYRSARALRGAAQIAREEAAARGGRVLENATRALLAGAIQLDATTTDRLRASAEDLRAVARGADGEARAQAIVARWAETGIDERPPVGAARTAQETRAFLEYAAREVAAVATELDRGIAELADRPMDREPLKAVLRRQRGLLGAARLDEIPVLAEALRAVEDLTSVIGKLDVAVRHEWLDVFRCARDVLAAATPLLETGRQPEVTTALRRLRVLRQELLERHGEGEAVSTAHDDSGLSQPETRGAAGGQQDVHGAAEAVAASTPAHAAADTLSARQEAAPEAASVSLHADAASARVAQQPMTEEQAAPQPTSHQPIAAATPIPPAPAAASAPTVPMPAAQPAPESGIDVRELQYRGERALQRAAELRPILERMLADTRGGREALAELYDLLRLARE